MVKTITSRINGVREQKLLFILFCLWLLVQLVSFLQFGIVTNNEAVKYRNEAYNILNTGRFSEPKYIFYSAYIFVRVLFIESGFENTGVFALQLLFNLLAMFCFFETAMKLSDNSAFAFVATLLLVLCYPWQYWTNFLYTESFFCSLIISFTFLLFGIKKRNIFRYLAALLLFAVILLARPTGILLIPVLCFLLLYFLLSRKKFIIAVSSAVLMLSAFIILLNSAAKAGSGFDFVKPIIENSVLCYISTQPQTGTALNGNAVGAIIHHFQSDPINFFKLSALKFFSFWGLTRPYYSTLHNWLLRIYFYPIYFFAFVGILSLKKHNRYFAVYSTAMLLIFTLTVMITCDDWNNRFLMPIIPLVILLATFGIRQLSAKFLGEA
ncbi:MAG TPA: glycosyltransferase family 39 protein [Parafilimonas sp.]|nr:glycosyltransferase family 39 protein [Parafilimonas sp.]